MTDQDRAVYALLQDALDSVKSAKPEDRSAKARCYAVVVTMLEQAVAYFAHFIIGGAD